MVEKVCFASRLKFSAGPSINQLIDSYFMDYAMMPLFVQENYIKVHPANASSVHIHLDKLSRAADAISDGDLVDKTIRSNMNFSMLPLHAFESCIR